MNMKGFTKSKIITVVIVALVAVALGVTLVFLLKGQQEDKKRRLTVAVRRLLS